MESVTEYQAGTTLVEVFKTNVHDAHQAVEIVCELKKLFPGFNINFDLEDCDRILRVDSLGKTIDVSRIKETLVNKGYQIEPLN